jgi:hypothetical protein
VISDRLKEGGDHYLDARRGWAIRYTLQVVQFPTFSTLKALMKHMRHHGPTIKTEEQTDGMFGRTKAASITLAVVAGLFGVSAAQATTRGGYCKLSEHWRVGASATWYGDTFKYAVLTSPDRLSTRDNFYSYVDDYGSPREVKFGRKGKGTNPYTYTASADWGGSSKVTIYVAGPNNSICTVELSR